MSIVYKTLFEIKLLHEYYLTRGDGSTIFASPLQQDRLDYLAMEFSGNRVPVNNDITFDFPEHLKSQYTGLGLRVLPAYSGCRIVMRVKPGKLADDSLVFEPFFPLAGQRDVFLLILRKNANLDLYTNSRIKRPFPSIYLFSNADLGSPKVFPFLTNSVPLQDSSIAYEQGELSLSGPDIQEYYRQGGTDKWNTVVGSGFVNESDRLLLPARFDYTFPETDGLTDVSFRLNDSSGNTVATVTRSDAGGLAKKVSLDFSGRVKLLADAGSVPLTESMYTLVVTGNNGFMARHTVLISAELTRNMPWAVVAVRPSVGNTSFSLIANDGYLIRRKDALGVWTPAPVFEIPVKSRLTYVRYVHNKGKALDVSAALTDYVDKEGPSLVTKQPRSVARDWFSLRKQGSNDTQYAPGPVSPELRLESDRRLFFNVMVQQSELFPEAP